MLNLYVYFSLTSTYFPKADLNKCAFRFYQTEFSSKNYIFCKMQHDFLCIFKDHHISCIKEETALKMSVL